VQREKTSLKKNEQSIDNKNKTAKEKKEMPTAVKKNLWEQKPSKSREKKREPEGIPGRLKS